MNDRSSRLRIIVLGYLVRGPIGGLAWHHLQYVVGLGRLGHDVYFFEDSDDYPTCYDPSTGAIGTDPTFGLRFTESAFRRLSLGDRWAYYDANALGWMGPAARSANDVLSSADVVINVSGTNPMRAWYEGIPARLLIDTDPVFTQIRHLTDPSAMQLATSHTHFFTFGENFGGPVASIPDDGLPWRPTRQPIVVDLWQAAPGPASAPFTTVMQWDSYAARELGGRRYGMKSASFPPFLDLPSHLDEPLEIALGSASAPRADLARRGWRISDPLVVAASPWSYQQYIRDSKAEFSVAKEAYVISHSGWFSERSAAYLASGRPVVIQDTGFTSWMAIEEGVLPFSDLDSACAAIVEVGDRYERHCAAARAIVEHYFDSDDVLGRLLDDVFTRAYQPPPRVTASSTSTQLHVEGVET